MKDFQPKILVFCCDWCAGAAADMAGVERVAIAPNFVVLRVPCAAQIDPEHILAAFGNGADGVMIASCHPTDCHHVAGAHRAQARLALTKVLLRQFGLEPDRLSVQHIEATEGRKYAQAVN
ncbi:hydrogenase iron-sulfur subunit, partial [bacterium]|nr:hydrogenase iron-sulfur subunit [bacterium]